MSEHHCRFVKWCPLPSDGKDYGFYGLICQECGRKLSESYIPSTFEVFDIDANIARYKYE
jgi:hypothetical protein